MTDSEYAGWHHVTYSAAQLQRGGRETKAACEMPYAAYGITETQPYEYIHFSIHSAPVSGCVPFDRIGPNDWFASPMMLPLTSTMAATRWVDANTAFDAINYWHIGRAVVKISWDGVHTIHVCEFLSYVTTIGQIFDVSCTPDAWFFAACTYCTVCKLCVCVFLIPATICINDLC